MQRWYLIALHLGDKVGEHRVVTEVIRGLVAKRRVTNWCFELLFEVLLDACKVAIMYLHILLESFDLLELLHVEHVALLGVTRVVLAEDEGPPTFSILPKQIKSELKAMPELLDACRVAPHAPHILMQFRRLDCLKLSNLVVERGSRDILHYLMYLEVDLHRQHALNEQLYVGHVL